MSQPSIPCSAAPVVAAAHLPNVTIRSGTVGALPIIDHFLQWLNLESFPKIAL